jgi:hypothetical protein
MDKTRAKMDRLGVALGVTLLVSPAYRPGWDEPSFLSDPGQYTVPGGNDHKLLDYLHRHLPERYGALRL